MPRATHSARPNEWPASDAASASAPAPRRLLIVDPDWLTQWSVTAYLRRGFEILTAASAERALAALRQRSVHAIVISDECPAGERVERFAREQNPAVMIIRTVNGVAPAQLPTPPAFNIEKPFALSELAAALGVSNR